MEWRFDVVHEDMERNAFHVVGVCVCECVCVCGSTSLWHGVVFFFFFYGFERRKWGVVRQRRTGSDERTARVDFVGVRVLIGRVGTVVLPRIALLCGEKQNKNVIQKDLLIHRGSSEIEGNSI